MRSRILLLCCFLPAGLSAAQGDGEGPLAEARALALAGQHAEAVPLYQELVTEVEQKDGKEAWPLVFLLYELAVQHHSLGAVGEAESLYQRSLSIAEKQRGPEHPALVSGLRGLATLAAMRGRLAEADSLYRRALRIQEAEEVSGTSIARTLAEIGLLNQLQGLPVDAESFYRRALEAAEPGELDETEIAMITGNLGALCFHQGRYDEAEPLYRRSLEIRERLLGPDHLDLAGILEELASLQYRRGRFVEAASIYQRSLQIRERAGQDDLAVAGVLGRLAASYRRLGRSVASEAHFGLAKAILDAQCVGREPAEACREAIRTHRDLRNEPAPSSQPTPAPRPVSETEAKEELGEVPEAAVSANSALPPPIAPAPVPLRATKAHRTQVAARQDPEESAEILQQLRDSHPDLLTDLAARIVSADLGERGVWHRVQIGEFADLAQAKALCVELTRRGHEGCWVITTED